MLASPADSSLSKLFKAQSAARVRTHALYYHLQYGLEYKSGVMCPGHLAIADPHSLGLCLFWELWLPLTSG